MTSKKSWITPQTFRSVMHLTQSDFEWLTKHGMIKIGRNGMLNGHQAACMLDRLARISERLPRYGRPDWELLEEAKKEAEEILSASARAEEYLKQRIAEAQCDLRRHIADMMGLADKCVRLAERHFALARGIDPRDLPEEVEEGSPDMPPLKWKH